MIYCPKCGGKLGMQEEKKARVWHYKWYNCEACNIIWCVSSQCETCPITVEEYAQIRLRSEG